MVFSGIILGFIVSKGRKLLDPKKIQAIVNMLPPKNPQQIQVFNGRALFYRCFIKKKTTIMAHITKMARKIETFIWTKECQKALELIKQKYNETSILISPNSHMESHVYTMHNY